MDYLVESGRTAPLERDFHGDMVQLAYFNEQLQVAIDAANVLDTFKKAFYYGKDNVVLSALRQEGHASFADMVPAIGTSEDELARYEFFVQVIHGILGIFTEAGELLEALQKFIKGEPIDLTNVKEEIGDIFWYVAILCRIGSFTFSDAQIANIAKLYRRFPGKFSELQAINRDTDSERMILEHFEGSEPSAPNSFEQELEALINKHSLENGSDTPDFIIAEATMGFFKTLNHAIRARERWYGRLPADDAGGTLKILPSAASALPPVTSPHGSVREDLETLAVKAGDSPIECDVPPPGWYCTRGKGHDGPCAAWRDDDPEGPKAHPV